MDKLKTEEKKTIEENKQPLLSFFEKDRIIINSFTPGLKFFEDYIASDEGERTIIDLIQKNKDLI